jgi:hypothetical protein
VVALLSPSCHVPAPNGLYKGVCNGIDYWINISSVTMIGG